MLIYFFIFCYVKHITEVVVHSDTFKFKDLPVARTRKGHEGSVTGKAAHAFYVSNKKSSTYPGYIMGKLLLPKRGIKDTEAVGACAQTFTVISCQPNSLELAYSDPTSSSSNKRMNLSTSTTGVTRFLLGPGDVFCIPPGNSYRLQNHSKSKECMLSWTIIRPTPKKSEEDER
jgi:centromere protein C